MRREPPRDVGNRTIPDMINFWPPGAPITARRVLENALRSLGCSASTGRPFLIQPPPWARRPYPRANCPVVQAGLRAGGWDILPRAQTYLARQQDRRVPGGARRVRHASGPAAGRRADHQAGPRRGSPHGSHRGHRPPLSGQEIITDMARRMLFEVAGERPGADLLPAAQTVPLPLVGITVAALAGAMQVRAANEPPDHLRGRRHHLRADAVRVRASPLTPGPGQAGDPAEICARRRCCAVPPGTSAASPTWPRTAASSRPGSRDGTQPAGRDPAPRRRRTVRARGRRLTRHTREPGQFPQGARRSIVPAGQIERRMRRPGLLNQ